MNKKVQIFILCSLFVCCSLLTYTVYDFIYLPKLVRIERCMEANIGPKGTWIAFDEVPKEKIINCGMTPFSDGLEYQSAPKTRNFIFTGEEVRIGVMILRKEDKYTLWWNRETRYLWRILLVDKGGNFCI